MQLKKILFSVLVAIMMFSLVALVATANDESTGLDLVADFNSATESADYNVVKPGTTFNYVLKIANNTNGISAVQVKISYDDSVLSLVGTKDGTLFNSADRTVVKTSDGSVSFVGMKEGFLNTLNDGEILTIQFKVNEDFDGDIESLVIVEDDVKITSGADMLTVPVSIKNVGTIKAHNYGDPIVTEPDCLNAGTIKYVCTECDDEIVSIDSTKPATGHTEPTDWIIDTPATCTDEGTKSKSCTECGALLFSEKIPAEGHNYSDWTIKTVATMDADGEVTCTCSVCGDVVSVTVSKLSAKDNDFTWKNGDDSNGLEFTAGAEIVSVSVNGKALSKNDYEISGSTVLLKADYLNTLEEGEYTLTVTSAYDHELGDAHGDATLTFNVENSNLAVIIIVIVVVVVLVGVVATVVVLKKKELI